MATMPQSDFECGGVVRLFPLGSVVLFPFGLLPLHIFEPRYRQMTADALASDRAIAMALPVGTTKQEPVPIHSIACVGTIHQEHRLDDGRYTFVLRGEARVRIDEELTTDRLYRSAKVTVVADQVANHLQTRRQLQRAHILESFEKLIPPEHKFAQHLIGYLRGGCRSAVFADIVAYAAPLTIATKQELLELPDVDRRLEILAEKTVEIANQLDESPPSKFPPAPSAN